jgi:hypothetical protein
VHIGATLVNQINQASEPHAPRFSKSPGLFDEEVGDARLLGVSQSIIFPREFTAQAMSICGALVSLCKHCCSADGSLSRGHLVALLRTLNPLLGPIRSETFLQKRTFE